jgi:hypothetical protein
LCPNHHAAFDLIADDLSLIGIAGQLPMHGAHKINIDHIRYHREPSSIAYG